MEFINPNMKAVMDAVKVKKASLAYRHELLLHQQRIHYQNERDRLDGIIHSRSANLPDHSIARLERRRDKLKELIQNDLYPYRD